MVLMVLLSRLERGRQETGLYGRDGNGDRNRNKNKDMVEMLEEVEYWRQGLRWERGS
jgi:hypothetical protein